MIYWQTILLLLIGFAAGLLSPYRIEARWLASEPDRNKRVLKEILKLAREAGDDEFVEVIEKTLSDVPAEDIVAEMSPQMRQRYERFKKDKKGDL